MSPSAADLDAPAPATAGASGEPAPGVWRTATQPDPSDLSSRQHSVRAGLGLGIAAVLFAFGVCIAFSLGFSRMRPEFPLDRPVGLVATPSVTFSGAKIGWFRLEGEGWDPSREQYGNIAEGDEAHCVFNWRTSRIGGGQIGTRIGSTDYEASRFLLRSHGVEPDEATSLYLHTDNNARIEVLFASRDDNDISTGHAVRAFSGSNHVVVFTIMCDRSESVTPALMNDALAGAKIELQTA